MNTERRGGIPVESMSPSSENPWKRISFNRYFREKFRRSIRKFDVPELGRGVRMIDVRPVEQTEPVVKVVVPGWTESIRILRPIIREWVKRGEHVISYTPGKLLNPNRKDYPQAIRNAIARLESMHGDSSEGRAALADQKKHKYFPIHVQRALELLAVVNNTKREEKVKLHAHSQGLPIVTIAALLQPEKVHSIVADSGAGTIGKDKVSRLGGRFVAHLAGGTLRAFKGPKDALRTVLGAGGAVKYVVRNRTKALREAGVISTSDVYPALEYLDRRYGIKSALITPDKDRLYPQRRVKAANNAHAEKTGYSTTIHNTKGGHNEIYVRAEKQVAVTAEVWNRM